MNIYLIRHGESIDDLNGCYGGVSNWPLTDTGKQQARRAGKQLSSCNIQAIYTSPMARAKESAEIIQSAVQNTPLFTVFDLHERNTYGVMSGLTPQAAQELFGYLVDKTGKVPGEENHCAPGGEEYSDFLTRVKNAFNYVITDAITKGYTSIAIVTHGKFTKALLNDVLLIDNTYNKELGSINHIEFIPPRLIKEAS